MNNHDAEVVEAIRKMSAAIALECEKEGERRDACYLAMMDDFAAAGLSGEVALAAAMAVIQGKIRNVTFAVPNESAN